MTAESVVRVKNAGAWNCTLTHILLHEGSMQQHVDREADINLCGIRGKILEILTTNIYETALVSKVIAEAAVS